MTYLEKAQKKDLRVKEKDIKVFGQAFLELGPNEQTDVANILMGNAKNEALQKDIMLALYHNRIAVREEYCNLIKEFMDKRQILQDKQRLAAEAARRKKALWAEFEKQHA